jgi:AcrR family transcriptional regulator
MSAAEPAAAQDAPPTARRVRKRPDDRRAEIIATARTVFADAGYAESGFGDIAAAANVSKGLLYHYFPEGRPELYVSVARELLAEFRERLRVAANLPFSPQRRLEQILAALFGFLAENPATFRLLFQDPLASRDPAVQAQAVAARVQISSELAAVMAASGLPAEELVAVSTGVLGFALANVELCLTGQLDPELAWRVTYRYASTEMPE